MGIVKTIRETFVCRARPSVSLKRLQMELEKEINSLQCLIETSNMKEEDKKDTLNALDTKTLELEKIIEYRTKGSILRARCRWHNEGEKKYKVLSQPRETTLQLRGNKPIKTGK